MDAVAFNILAIALLWDENNNHNNNNNYNKIKLYVLAIFKGGSNETEDQKAMLKKVNAIQFAMCSNRTIHMVEKYLALCVQSLHCKFLSQIKKW